MSSITKALEEKDRNRAVSISEYAKQITQLRVEARSADPDGMLL